MSLPIPIPNFIQGVSQQAEQQRRATQAEEQLNCINSPSEGSVARPSSEIIAIIDPDERGDWVGAFFYEFNRGDEHYVVVIRSIPGAPPDSTLEVYNLVTGVKATVASINDDYATAVLTIHDIPVANDTVVIGEKTYTWKASVTTTADQVKIGATAALSVDALVAAINGDEDEAGVLYGSDTLALGTFAADSTGLAITILAITAGPGANGLELLTTGTAADWDRELTSEGAWNASAIQDYINLITTIPEQAFCAVSINDDILIANRNIPPNIEDGARSPTRPKEALFHFRAGMYSSTYMISIRHLVGNSFATGTFTLDEIPANNDTVTIGARVYTFKTALTPAANEVLINSTGSDDDEKMIFSARNLNDAINATTGSGTEWGAGTVAHADVTSHWADKAITVTAIVAGSSKNSIATTQTGDPGDWGAATLTGGGETGNVYKFTYTTPDNSVEANAKYITTNHLASTFYKAMTGGSTASKKLASAWTSDYYDEPEGDVGNIYRGTSGGGLFGSGGGSGTGPVDLTTLGFSFSVNGSMVHIWTLSDDFEIDSDDANGGNHLVAFKDEVANFAKLPNGGFPGYVAKVRGDKASGDDDFYASFAEDKPIARGGAWQEDVAPDVPVRVLDHTLPFLLVNTAEDAFRLEFAPWGSRVVGDADLDPAPYVFGDYIRDLMFNNRRLGFVCEGSITWSKAGDAFVLFRATVQELLADDPISFQVNHTETPILEKGVTASEVTALWARNVQFTVRNDNQAFKAESIEIKASSSFEYAHHCRPLQVGHSLYFAEEEEKIGEQAGYSTLRDLIYKESKLIGETEITAHVPQYIPAGVNRLSGSQVRGMLFASSVQYSGDGTGGFGIQKFRPYLQPGLDAGTVMAIEADPGPSTGDGGAFNFVIDVEANRAYRYRSLGVTNAGNLRVFDTLTGDLIESVDHDDIFQRTEGDELSPTQSFDDLGAGKWTLSASGRYLFGPTANLDPDYDAIYGIIDTETLQTPFDAADTRGVLRESNTDITRPHQIIPAHFKGIGEDVDYFFIVQQIGITTANVVNIVNVNELLDGSIYFGVGELNTLEYPGSGHIVEGVRGGELYQYSEVYLWEWNNDKISATQVILYRLECVGELRETPRIWDPRTIRTIEPADIDPDWDFLSDMTFSVDLFDGNLVGIATNYPDLTLSYIFKLDRETGDFLWRTRVGPDYDFPTASAHFGPDYRLTNSYYGWIGRDGVVNTIYRINLADGAVSVDLNGVAEGFAGFAGIAGTQFYDGFSSLFFYAQLSDHDNAFYTPLGEWATAHNPEEEAWDQNWVRLWLDPDYAPAPVEGMFIAAPTEGDAEFTATGNEVLYYYNFFFSNDERVQSAWSKWTFLVPVAWHSMQRSILRTIQAMPDGSAILARTNCSPRYFDPGHTDYHTRLDHRLDQDQVTMEWDSVLDLTTVTLPYTILDSPMFKVILAETSAVNGSRGQELAYELLGADRIVLSGDRREDELFFGYTISSEITLSTPYARDGQGDLVPYERLQLADLTVQHKGSGPYRIEITDENGNVTPYTNLPKAAAPPTALGQVNLLTGSLRAPINKENDRCTIKLINDTVFPSKWLSGEYGVQRTTTKDRGK